MESVLPRQRQFESPIHLVEVVLRRTLDRLKRTGVASRPEVDLLVGRLLREISSQIRTAQDVDDLHFQLGEIATAPEFLSKVAKLSAQTSTKDVDEVTKLDPSDANFERGLDETFGVAVRRHLQRGIATVVEVARLQGLADWEVLSKAFGEPTRGSGAPNDFLTNSTIPTEIAEVLLSALKGDVALLGLLGVCELTQPIEPWFNLALAVAFEEGQRDRLKVFSLLPNLKISESLLPDRERLDLSKLATSAKKRKMALARAAIDLRRGGKPVGKFPED